MSSVESVSQDELLELIQAGPAEAFREHADAYRELRDDVESEYVRRLIDHGLQKYARGGE